MHVFAIKPNMLTVITMMLWSLISISLITTIMSKNCYGELIGTLTGIFVLIVLVAAVSSSIAAIRAANAIIAWRAR